MNNEILSRAIGKIDDELIGEYYKTKERLRRERRRRTIYAIGSGALAACLCIATVILMPWISIGKENSMSSDMDPYYSYTVKDGNGIPANTSCFKADDELSEEKIIAPLFAVRIVNTNTSFSLPFLADADSLDLAGYTAEPGCGVTRYIESVSPDTGEELISYDITHWPDESSKGWYVTRIYCADRSVSFFGVTLNDKIDDIASAIKKAGFDVKVDREIDDDGAVFGRLTAEMNGIHITVIISPSDLRELCIRADVSNIEGIVY